MTRSFSVSILMVLGVILSNPYPAAARIKLITLPVRERVEIQLDHPNVTLVEEERIVPLVKGLNQVDFSWANTQIDPKNDCVSDGGARGWGTLGVPRVVGDVSTQ